LERFKAQQTAEPSGERVSERYVLQPGVVMDAVMDTREQRLLFARATTDLLNALERDFDTAVERIEELELEETLASNKGALSMARDALTRLMRCHDSNHQNNELILRRISVLKDGGAPDCDIEVFKLRALLQARCAIAGEESG
jgi:hypothetical protein